MPFPDYFVGGRDRENFLMLLSSPSTGSFVSTITQSVKIHCHGYFSRSNCPKLGLWESPHTDSYVPYFSVYRVYQCAVDIDVPTFEVYNGILSGVCVPVKPSPFPA